LCVFKKEKKQEAALLLVDGAALGLREKPCIGKQT
jgi:hypothetical protein